VKKNKNSQPFMSTKRRRTNKMSSCAECAGCVVDPVTCTTCAQDVCYASCGRRVSTVMWIGRPVDTYTCLSCFTRMKQCRICRGWSTGRDTLCVRCINKYCEVCHREDRVKIHKICHDCTTRIRVDFDHVIKAPDVIQTCILSYIT
jgi:hypothetical protein